MPLLTRIVKRFTFEAAHQLPNHNGHCRRLHGHSYTVEVGLSGPVNPARGLSDDGMVLDFGDVSAAFKERIHSRLDHQYLNDVLSPMLTTAENISGWILGQLAPVLDNEDTGRQVDFVRVWETATGYAEARR